MQPTSLSGDVEVFDPRGDLRLIVGSDQIAFQVCSRALARSSEYWETLLYGAFAEGQGQQEAGSDWVIPLPEDRPEGLRILCLAVHGRFDALPGKITHGELLYLTVLADKYNMISSLKPFWKGWLKELDYITDSTPAADELLDYLSVCYKLGYGRGFRKAFVYVVKCAAAHGDGRLYIDGDQDHDIYGDDHVWLRDKVLGQTPFAGGDVLNESDADPNVEGVRRGREIVLTIICTKIQRGILSLIFESGCTAETPSKVCNCTMLGSLVRAMASRKLDRWFNDRMEGVADSITSCVSDFSSLLAELREEAVAARESFDWEHGECRPWASESEKMGDEGMDALYEIIYEFAADLEGEAKKSGLNPDNPARFSTPVPCQEIAELVVDEDQGIPLLDNGLLYETEVRYLPT